jgi:ATP-dependent exoDNAse (exonuclease V) alpha subunit
MSTEGEICTEINTNENNSESLNSENINSESLNSESLNSESINSESINSESINSENINSENINSENINSAEIINENKISELETLYPELYKAIFKDRRNILISGIGGTGKTYSLNLIRNECQKVGIKCEVTSTTGTSAHAIKGNTIHRFSGIKLGTKPLATILADIKKKKDKVKGWKDIQILIIDEVSMLGAKTLKLINDVGQHIRYGGKIMKDIKNSKHSVEILPFGGVQVIFSADFLQLPPVNDEFAFKSPVWEKLNLFNFRMVYPYRYPDISHFEMLSRFRTAQFTPEDVQILRTRVKEYEIYRQKERWGQINEEIKPTRIYSLNRDVETVNMQELEKLEGDIVAYECNDVIIPKNKENHNFHVHEYTEFLDTVAEREIYLKEKAQVMLTTNLDVESGLTNGSRGVVMSCEDNLIAVKFKNGETINITPYPYEHEDDEVIAVRHQFPLKLAWSYSIHKSQGATLDYAIIDLGTSLFCPALGYVALSRCRTLNGLYIVNIVPDKIKADPEALKFEEELIKTSVLGHKIDE